MLLDHRFPKILPDANVVYTCRQRRSTQCHLVHVAKKCIGNALFSVHGEVGEVIVAFLAPRCNVVAHFLPRCQLRLQIVPWIKIDCANSPWYKWSKCFPVMYFVHIPISRDNDPFWIPQIGIRCVWLWAFASVHLRASEDTQSFWWHAQLTNAHAWYVWYAPEKSFCLRCWDVMLKGQDMQPRSTAQPFPFPGWVRTRQEAQSSCIQTIRELRSHSKSLQTCDGFW